MHSSRNLSLQETCVMVGTGLGLPNVGLGAYGPLFWVSVDPSVIFGERAAAVARGRGSSMYAAVLLEGAAARGGRAPC